MTAFNTVQAHTERWTQGLQKAKWLLLVGSILVALVMTVYASGCAVQPRQQYVQLNDTYIATLESLIELRSAGQIDDETWNTKVVPLVREGGAVLDEIDAATKTGQPLAPLTVDRLKEVLQRLQPYIVKPPQGAMNVPGNLRFDPDHHVHPGLDRQAGTQLAA